MASSDEAEKAIQELDGASVKGSRMRVEVYSNLIYFCSNKMIFDGKDIIL